MCLQTLSGVVLVAVIAPSGSLRYGGPTSLPWEGLFMPDSLPGPRLRQVALVAPDCEKTATALQDTFGWPDPFHDPGVGEFGLINAVFPGLIPFLSGSAVCLVLMWAVLRIFPLPTEHLEQSG